MHNPSNGQGQNLSSYPWPHSNYRVSARYPQGVVALVAMAKSQQQAVALARQFRDQTLAAPNGQQNGQAVREVFVEEWVGSLFQGRWRRLDPGQGGFRHAFHNGPRPASGGAKVSSRQLRSGQIVPCILLEEKTQKGGWKAQLADRELSGPVTQSDRAPAQAAAGQKVLLRIGAVSKDGTRIQFDWPSPGKVRSEE